MKDAAYLRLLSREFPNRQSAITEIINLSAILELPKGTEYFFSDIHGEDKAFIHLLRSSSGIIRSKIRELFAKSMTEKEQSELAALIYYPKRKLKKTEREFLEREDPEGFAEWQRLSIYRLICLCRYVSSKYTRSKVRKKIPKSYVYIIEELLQVDETEDDKQTYYRSIVNAIVGIGSGKNLITILCDLIHSLSIDSLHIIGDIFDRGPHPDLVMEELRKYKDVDVEWGNHDVSWIGAFCGNQACVCNVVRIALSYNHFDLLEDSYGINLRPLSMFAQEAYGTDPCSRFQPHLLDQNEYDAVSPELAARMHKAIAIIQFKLEGQLIMRHPEYDMEDRLLLQRIDYTAGTISMGGRCIPLSDRNFPTVDPKDPYRLTPAEEKLVDTLTSSFRHSQLLKKHLRFLFAHGQLYKIVNRNLLFHGCIPLRRDGSFDEIYVQGKTYAGRALMDYFDQKIRDAYFLHADDPKEAADRAEAVDLLWYLWCGKRSPLFGKSRITTFERYFTDDPRLKQEDMNPYYELSNQPEIVEQILSEFGISPKLGHIVNGHVPVREKEGELPYRAGGRLFVIDGGLARSYHQKTGIAGYTMIFNSRSIAIASHKPFAEGHESSPKVEVIEHFEPRIRVADTDTGAMLKSQIEDLQDLLQAYQEGQLPES